MYPDKQTESHCKSKDLPCVYLYVSMLACVNRERAALRHNAYNKIYLSNS